MVAAVQRCNPRSGNRAFCKAAEGKLNTAMLHAVSAFWRTRRLARRLRSRDDVVCWRERQLRRFFNRTLRRVPFYAAGETVSIGDLPIMDKATLLANFDRLNTKAVTLAEARAALARGEDRVRGLVVGQSTGTSGNRGVFVISEAERFTWLGVILAKTLPDFPWVRHRVALILPGFGRLYASAAETGRLTLRFFDLSSGLASWRNALLAYAPDTILAPPKVLRLLAEAGGLRPGRVFSGAEVLDPLDRRIIEAGFGTVVREIYMATEGLFGVGCDRGTLHLAEDAVAFDWEAAGGLVAPLITDFTRSTQVMARYRMNDLLRLSPTPCSCGSPLQAVTAIEGRRDDMFLLPGRAGAIAMTPDVIRNAVVDADRRIEDFRVVQIGADEIELALAADLPSEVFASAAAALQAAVSKVGAAPVRIRYCAGLVPPLDRKLRRVRRDWAPTGRPPTGGE
jgi:putative adenylate-forming enzyme